MTNTHDERPMYEARLVHHEDRRTPVCTAKGETPKEARAAAIAAYAESGGCEIADVQADIDEGYLTIRAKRI